MVKNDLLMVGELAKKMGVSVRTLQYYDKEGLLKPSSTSEGGRRLYSEKDIVKLHQILSFKYLGFSLKEIKGELFLLDDPKEVLNMLEFQKKAIENQIYSFQKALEATTYLQTEVMNTDQVDFGKYSEIIELIKVGNEGCWAWKCFNTPLKEHVRNRFGSDANEGIRIYETYKEVLEEALILKQKEEPPESDISFVLAKKWWDMIMDFTGGDMSLIPELEKFNANRGEWGNDFADKQKEVESFMEEALKHYLTKLYG